MICLNCLIQFCVFDCAPGRSSGGWLRECWPTACIGPVVALIRYFSLAGVPGGRSCFVCIFCCSAGFVLVVCFLHGFGHEGRRGK